MQHIINQPSSALKFSRKGLLKVYDMCTSVLKFSFLVKLQSIFNHLSLLKIVLTILSILFLVSLQSSQAQQYNIDSLLSLLQNSKIDTNRVNILYKLSNALSESKPDNAMQYANQGFTLSQKLAFKKGQSICLNALGLAYYQVGKFDTALICFEKRLKLVTEIKDLQGLAEVYDNLAVLNIHLGKNDKALELRKKANDIYLSLNKKILLASGYIWIGNIYKEKGDYSSALENYLKSIKLYEEEFDENGIAYPLLNISSVYRYLKQYSQARIYANEAKSKFVKSKNQKGIGVSLYRLALIYFEEKDYDNAIKLSKEAKKLFEEIQDAYFTLIVNQMLGTCYHDMGNSKVAIDYAESALRVAQQIGDLTEISGAFQNISIMYSDQGDYLRALEYLHKSEGILNKTKDKKSLLNLSANFVDLFSRINKPDSVVYYFKRYQALTDTIFNEQNSRSIAEMQTKYEAEKKDKEILALNLEAEKKKNTIWAIVAGSGILLVVLLSGFMVFRNKKKREQAVLAQMASESDMKALRSQMNPHFIFNCIHTINGLLNELKIQESKTCLDKFSNLTRSVLENSKKREIPLSAELEILRLYMDLENMRFTNPFQYEFVIEPSIDPETTLVPPLILQPFVENSIKHGFRDPEKPGQLKIEISTENESLVCSVEDNGVGRNMVNIKTSSGFKKESLGIKLTEERLDLISKTKKTKSHFLINDLVDAYNKPAGTCVKIILPYELSV